MTSSITSIACPAYVFELVDTVTISAPDAGVFTSDLVSATKTLDVATSDPLKAATYTLALSVYYAGLKA